MHQVKVHADVLRVECTWIQYQARLCDCLWLIHCEKEWQQSVAIFSSSLCYSAISDEEVGTDAGRHRLLVSYYTDVEQPVMLGFGDHLLPYKILSLPIVTYRKTSPCQIWNCLSQCQLPSHNSYQLSAHKATWINLSIVYCLLCIFLSKLWTL